MRLARLLAALLACLLCVPLVACEGSGEALEDGSAAATEAQAESSMDEESGMEQMTITVNGETFEVELEDNETARAFAALMPLELPMEELNGNEKYYYLDQPLPSAPEAVGEIHAGDVMLFGDSCVVLFYQDFHTSYTYTRIGHVADPAGLAQAVGTGDAMVAFAR